MLSALTKAHFCGVLWFLQMSGFECRHPSAIVSVSRSDKGRFLPVFLMSAFACLLFFNSRGFLS